MSDTDPDPGLENALEAFKSALAAEAERSNAPEGEEAHAPEAPRPTPAGREGSRPAAASKPLAKRRPSEEPAPASPVPAAAEPRGRRKVREGIVASSAMDKTAVVVVVERVRHPRYAKTVQLTKRLYAHDEGNDVRVGDRVRITETRPLSKLKRWRVEQVLERAR